jgi:CrcB protein
MCGDASLAMIGYLFVFIGAGLGGMLRHAVNIFSLRLFGPAFPWGTFIINVSGSFLMGIVTGYLAFKTHAAVSPNLRLLLTAGIIGGYTTFSTFSLDAISLWERGAALHALLYIVFSVMLGVSALLAGLSLMRAVS